MKKSKTQSNKPYTIERAKEVHRHMDHPVQHIGQYKLPSVKGNPILTTYTHNMLYHNPVRVAHTFSGTKGGLIPNSGDLNAARLHKLQDISVNKTHIDGWETTPKMRMISDELISFYSQKGHFPVKLPAFVDHSGDKIIGGVRQNKAMQKVTSAAYELINGKTMPKQTPSMFRVIGKKTVRIAGKAMGPIAIGSEIVIIQYEITNIEKSYDNEEITYCEKQIQKSESVGAARGALIGVGTGAAIGTCICPVIGTLGGGFIGGISIGIAGGYAGKAYGESQKDTYNKELTQRIEIQRQSAQYKEEFIIFSEEGYRKIGISEEKAQAYAQKKEDLQ